MESGFSTSCSCEKKCETGRGTYHSYLIVASFCLAIFYSLKSHLIIRIKGLWKGGNYQSIEVRWTLDGRGQGGLLWCEHSTSDGHPGRKLWGPPYNKDKSVLQINWVLSSGAGCIKPGTRDTKLCRMNQFTRAHTEKTRAYRRRIQRPPVMKCLLKSKSFSTAHIYSKSWDDGSAVEGAKAMNWN